MRLVILTASIVAFGVLVLLGLVHLVQELLIKEFFHPPSMPGENSNSDHQASQPSGTGKPNCLRRSITRAISCFSWRSSARVPASAWPMSSASFVGTVAGCGVKACWTAALSFTLH